MFVKDFTERYFKGQAYKNFISNFSHSLVRNFLSRTLFLADQYVLDGIYFLSLPKVTLFLNYLS
jgi:hypothetical protein